MQHICHIHGTFSIRDEKIIIFKRSENAQKIATHRFEFWNLMKKTQDLF